MCRYISVAALLFCVICCYSCNSDKPKSVSDDITKTEVTVNGQKDSVINNPQKKYGNATVAEPCVKCLIQVIQNTIDYKVAIASKSTKDLKYIVNWTETSPPPDTSIKHSTTNGLKVDILEKNDANTKFASFIYDNSTSKLYFVLNNGKNEVNLNKADLKKIRNKCYWGVASSR